jgi:hypothetical protein
MGSVKTLALSLSSALTGVTGEDSSGVEGLAVGVVTTFFWFLRAFDFFLLPPFLAIVYFLMKKRRKEKRRRKKKKIKMAKK